MISGLVIVGSYMGVFLLLVGGGGGGGGAWWWCLVVVPVAVACGCCGGVCGVCGAGGAATYLGLFSASLLVGLIRWGDEVGRWGWGEVLAFG